MSSTLSPSLTKTNEGQQHGCIEGAMMNYSWHWGVLVESPYLGWLGWGILITMMISLVSWVIALTIGTGVGVLHSLTNRKIRLLTGTYISIFRHIPLLLPMCIWFFFVH